MYMYYLEFTVSLFHCVCERNTHTRAPYITVNFTPVEAIYSTCKSTIRKKLFEENTLFSWIVAAKVFCIK